MKRTIFSSLVGFAILGFSPSVHAAALYIDPTSAELFSGDSVTLSVRLDVDEEVGECVNAIDATITYPPNIIPVDYSIGESIMRVWVQEPNIDKEAGTITLAGGIPNGYCGRIEGDPRLTNNVVDIVFRAPGLVVSTAEIPTDGSATVDFAPETSAYLNDGIGSQASLSTYGATITINDSPGPRLENEWREKVNSDNFPPEEFSISLQQDRTAFGGRHYIIFSTVDKQTGLSGYEVMEEPLSRFGSFSWGASNAPWITARSPYVLKDQTLNSIIRVKAIDKAGNEYVASLIPEESMRGTQAALIWWLVLIGAALLIVFILAVLAVMAIKRVLRRRQKRATKPTPEAAVASETAEEIIDPNDSPS